MANREKVQLKALYRISQFNIQAGELFSESASAAAALVSAKLAEYVETGRPRRAARKDMSATEPTPYSTKDGGGPHTTTLQVFPMLAFS